MKTILGLIVVVALVLGTMAGCGTMPSEQGYRDVSVGPMAVSIPDDWERPVDYAELVAATSAGFTAEEMQAIEVDAYGDESEDAALVIMTMDVVGLFESTGVTWRGWDIELGEMGITAGEFAEFVQYGMVYEFTELSLETHQQLAIGGNEAWETTYTAKSDDESVQICVLIVFAPSDAGILLMIADQGKWGKYEEVWEEIRDSVRT